MYLDHDIQWKCENVVLDNLNNSASHNIYIDDSPFSRGWLGN